MKLIERKQYLDKMINTVGTPDIKVLTGVHFTAKMWYYFKPKHFGITV